MSEFKEIKATEISGNLIEKLSKEWMLITAQKEDKVNTMTASWGGFGELWGKDVSYIVVRPSRYTYEFLEQGEYYSLCFFDASKKDVLTACGKESGRNVDKIEKHNLTVSIDNAPYFEEAELVLICKKLYSQMLEKENFVCKEFAEQMYPDNDIHKLYVGEIVKVLEK
ncbi:MAG: flavin reductase [Clostridia bacterium]|nr:flavin reductase [Clostridia bacterium]